MADSKIKFGIGLTINLGNYSSAKVDVGLEIPANSEDLDTSYERAVEYCNEKLMSEVSSLQTLKGKL